jgi:hypothetical protein
VCKPATRSAKSGFGIHFIQSSEYFLFLSLCSQLLHMFQRDMVFRYNAPETHTNPFHIDMTLFTPFSYGQGAICSTQVNYYPSGLLGIDETALNIQFFHRCSNRLYTTDLPSAA